MEHCEVIQVRGGCSNDYIYEFNFFIWCFCNVNPYSSLFIIWWGGLSFNWL